MFICEHVYMLKKYIFKWESCCPMYLWFKYKKLAPADLKYSKFQGHRRTIHGITKHEDISRLKIDIR